MIKCDNDVGIPCHPRHTSPTTQELLTYDSRHTTICHPRHTFPITPELLTFYFLLSTLICQKTANISEKQALAYILSGIF